MPPLNAGPLLVQRASEGALGGLRRLVRDLRLDAHLHGDLILTGRDPVIRSPHRLGKAAATAQLLHLPRIRPAPSEQARRDIRRLGVL
jgi:hypothetical protein